MPKIDTSKYITKVSEVPFVRGRGNNPIYDSILENLGKSGVGSYKVEIPDKQMKTVFYALHKRIQHNKLPMELKVRSGVLYVVIEKTKDT